MPQVSSAAAVKTWVAEHHPCGTSRTMFPRPAEFARNRGDNSPAAITTAGIRNTSEFSTHISAPAAT